jgi:hypothetical protein
MGRCDTLQATGRLLVYGTIHIGRTLPSVSVLTSFIIRALTSYPRRQLQKFERTESNIRDFFEMYGPSARDCYACCSDIGSFQTFVRSKVGETTWLTITKALTGGVEGLNTEEASHNVILVGPQQTTLPFRGFES